MNANKNLMHAVICAGGKGSRIASAFPDSPKALIPVFEKPIIIEQIEKLSKQGIIYFHLLLGYKSEKIVDFVQNYFRSHSAKIEFIFHREERPLGSGGALLHFCEQLPNEFILIYCDIYFDININKFYNYHKQSQAGLTMFVHPNDHPYDSDLVCVGNNDRVSEIIPHPHQMDVGAGNLVNAAIYIVSRTVLDDVSYTGELLDFAQNVVPTVLKNGAPVYAYRSPEFAKDMGTNERLIKVRKTYGSRFRFNDKNPVVLLDRDGTINSVQKGEYITNEQDLILIEGVAEAIKLIRDKGYFIMVVTNQPVIARGDVTERQLTKINQRLDYLLGLKNAYIDALFYCPHHPHRGFEGEVKDLKIECTCRKPNTGLLEKANEYIRINREISWMVGDMPSDVSAGRSFGLNTVLLSGDNIDTDATLQVRNLSEFAEQLADLGYIDA